MKSKYITYLVLGLLTITSCGKKTDTDASPKEDIQAKKTIQGVWMDEEEGDATFYFKGDTCYYPVGTAEPVSFNIYNDTIHFNTSQPTAYAIKALTKQTFRFINADGDEVCLVRSTSKADIKKFIEVVEDSLTINQNTKIKRDTTVNVGDTHFRIYTQVNPKSERVYKQTMNDDGIAVDNAFYGNSVYITIMEGNACKFRHNFHKVQFKKLIPADFLNQSILSDITFTKSTPEGVEFTAVIAQPDTYSSYNVGIKVSKAGKMSMALQ